MLVYLVCIINAGSLVFYYALVLIVPGQPSNIKLQHDKH